MHDMDSAAAIRSRPPGGVIVRDDFYPEDGPGVNRALRQLSDRATVWVADTRFALDEDCRRASKGALA
jgi:hypothetical protein